MEDTRLQKLFRILRSCGAAMVVAAAGTFLVQRWDEAAYITRYAALLAMTVLLPALAYVCGIGFREGRSARVLMLTLLALFPIHVGVLGGFVYSQFGPEMGRVAAAAQWIAESRSQAVAVIAAATVVLVPLMWAAFRSLARSQATQLTAASVGLHALVLVPNRTSTWATLAVLAAFGGATWLTARIRPQTREAWLASASLLLPGVLLTARQLAFYDVTQVFFATISAIGALGMFSLGRELGDTALERFAISPMLVSGALFASPIQDLWGLSDASTIMLLGVLLAAVMLAFGWRSTRSRSFFVRGAFQLDTAISLATLLLHGSAWAALQSIALGLALLSYGFVTERRLSTYLGIAIAATGFMFEIALAIDQFGWGGWTALAAFGLILVAITAWLEHRARAVTGSFRIRLGDRAPDPKSVDSASRRTPAFESS